MGKDNGDDYGDNNDNRHNDEKNEVKRLDSKRRGLANIEILL